MNTNDRITLDTLAKKRDELRAQGNASLAQGKALLAEAETIEKTIDLINRDALARSVKSGELNPINRGIGTELPNSISVSNIESFPLEKLKGLSQMRAAVVIAKHCGGVLRPFDVEQILVSAGMMKKTPNSPNVASRLLRDNPRFERLAQGLYRLIGSKPEKDDVIIEKKSDATELRTIQ